MGNILAMFQYSFSSKLCKEFLRRQMHQSLYCTSNICMNGDDSEAQIGIALKLSSLLHNKYCSTYTE